MHVHVHAQLIEDVPYALLVLRGAVLLPLFSQRSQSAVAALEELEEVHLQKVDDPQRCLSTRSRDACVHEHGRHLVLTGGAYMSSGGGPWGEG